MVAGTRRHGACWARLWDVASLVEVGRGHRRQRQAMQCWARRSMAPPQVGQSAAVLTREEPMVQTVSHTRHLAARRCELWWPITRRRVGILHAGQTPRSVVDMLERG
jgi:hypothetical protein